MSGLPKVAVIIANHNYGKWVDRAMASAAQQNYEGESKVFIVDDASTDSSVYSIKQTISQLTHFTYGKNKFDFMGLANNGGPSFARNVIMKYSIQTFNPDVFMILDADDQYYENKVQRSVDVWMTDPDGIGVVYADYHIQGNNGYLKYEHKPAFSYRRLLQENIVHSNSLISRKALETVGLYDEKLRTCEDYDLWIRIGQKFVIKHIPESLMLVRAMGHNVSHITDSNRVLWQDSMKYLREKHGKKLHSEN